jgi:hypothetical protein
MSTHCAPLAVALWVVAEAGECGDRREVVAFRAGAGYDPRAARHLANLHAALPTCDDDDDAWREREERACGGPSDGDDDDGGVALPVHCLAEGEGAEDHATSPHGAGWRGPDLDDLDEAFGEAAPCGGAGAAAARPERLSGVSLLSRVGGTRYALVLLSQHRVPGALDAAARATLCAVRAAAAAPDPEDAEAAPAPTAPAAPPVAAHWLLLPGGGADVCGAPPLCSALDTLHFPRPPATGP